jgi:hypothetical protein
MPIPSRRARAAEAAAVAASVLVIVAAGVGAVRATIDFGERADANSALDYADREVAWGNGWTLTSDALYAARSLIPSDTDYEVRVGPAERFDSPLTQPYVASYLHYFLMPRHPRTGARWVICYRCEQPAGEVDVVWNAPNEGVSILRRRT